ncbi:family 43 glycosylhydrolase [Cytobacillus oceanisediminis]|uniref:glycoside hydrolase family 117 protein n=1 Tax=Cytobacillus oceanisediminis TaxID=665099 RepID=UPI001CCDB911|nr:family 43 glycosylhydrolase [Cytobacillus oceanisediminis]MBZ9536109.1 family 43 glycosylhydrolase [Cytobacillus oceanisediminis]
MKGSKVFPAVIPTEKPMDLELSNAMRRMFDIWNPYEDRQNDFYSSFKYSEITGIGKEEGVSRRDPSKVIKVNGTYYVWYTRRQTEHPPVGPANCTDDLPAYDWDHADVYYATSKDGFHWEEQGAAVTRAAKGEYGDRSVTTPDILLFNGKYYLYYQTYTGAFKQDKGDNCNVSMAWSHSPVGPWHRLDKPVIELGDVDEWDSCAIHDPYLLVYKDKIWMYYKGEPLNPNNQKIVRAQGVAIADHPEGPFVKSSLNPVLNSGHETGLYPFGEGIAAIISRDGPEKNTIQYASDGLNFEVKSHLSIPPLAPGPFCPDAFADDGDGQGISWGLCHTFTAGDCNYIMRFDCDLKRQTQRPQFKQTYNRFQEETFLQPMMKLDDETKNLSIKNAATHDRETVIKRDIP